MSSRNLKAVLFAIALAIFSFAGVFAYDWATGGVNVKGFGAKGDLQSTFDAATTSGSSTVSFSSFSGFTAKDAGKVAIIDMDPVGQPALVAICHATGASAGSCDGLNNRQSGTCVGTAAIDTTAGERAVFVRFQEKNSSGNGRASFEMWDMIPQGGTYCIKITNPTTVVASPSATNWTVYAAIDCCAPWQGTHSYALNTQILDANGYIEQVTACSGGCPQNSGGSTPAWTTSTGGTTTDGVLTWTNEGYRRQFAASGTEQLQSTSSQCNNGVPALGTACELDTINTGTSSVPTPQYLITTIASVTDSSHVVLNANATQTTLNTGFHWATDDRAAIQAAATSLQASIGGGLFFPVGSYYVSCASPGVPALSFTGTGFFRLTGHGAAGSKNLGAANPNYSAAAEIVGGLDPSGTNCSLLQYGTSGSQTFSGMAIEHLGFRDITQGAVLAPAIINFGAAHFKFLHSSVSDYFSAPAIKFDSGGAGLQSQFNLIDDGDFVAVKTGLWFTDGKSSENWIINSVFAGAETGGGAGIQWDTNGGSTTGGGGEHITQDQFLYFPTTILSSDRGTMEFVGVRAENTSLKQPYIAGGSACAHGADATCSTALNYGIGMFFDGSATKQFCTDTRVNGGSMNFMHIGYLITNNCNKFYVAFVGTSTSDGQMVDFGSSEVSLNGNQGLRFTDTNGNLTAKITGGAGDAQFNSLKILGSPANINTNTGIDMNIGTVNASTGALVGGVAVGAGTWTATSAATIDPTTISGGNTNTTDTASKAGDVGMVGGAANAWTSSGPLNGNVYVDRYYGTSSGVLGAVECFSASVDRALVNCAVSSTQPVGINVGLNGTSTKIRVLGEATVQYDGTYTALRNWYACTSATTVGTVTPQAAACAAGRQVGIFPGAQPSGTSGTILIQFK